MLSFDMACATSKDKKAVWGRYKHHNNEKTEAMEEKVMTKEQRRLVSKKYIDEFGLTDYSFK